MGTDLFEFKKSTYLLIVDYYSRWIEIARLGGTTSEEVIRVTSSIFARHGIPEVVVSDNGPQFSAEAYAKFAQTYGFEHVTSSPHYPKSNGEAERAVQTVKNLLKKSGDHYLALLAYRNTPLQCGYSPAQLLMSRNLRTTLPDIRERKVPMVVDPLVFKEKDNDIKQRQKRNYDSRHKAKELPLLEPGDSVWIPDRESTGRVVAPRSLVVETSDGPFRRNRQHLVPFPQTDTDCNSDQEGQSEPTHHRETRSRAGRLPPPPLRFDPSWN